MPSSLLSAFVGAIQASLSVLLVISYGSLAAHLGLLDSKNGKAISKISVKMFLPALLLVQLGTEMRPGAAHRYLIVVLWAVVAHIVSFVIGIAAHLLFKMPDWITCAIMFNNTTSYPLLLVQSLDHTGILEVLVGERDSTRALVGRAKSYFLVFSTISSCLTFAVGPRLIDTEHAPDSDGEERRSSLSSGTLTDGDSGPVGFERRAGPNERTVLLRVPRRRRRGEPARHTSVASLTFFPSKPKFTTVKRRPMYIPSIKWSELSPRTKWWLLLFYDFLNTPLIGAVLGAVIGLVRPLHTAFFGNTFDGGIFTAWLTESFKSLGQLFVPLPLVVAGISLYSSYQDSRHASRGSPVARIPWLTTAFILAVRFVIWPVLSIGAIYWVAKKERLGGVLGDDPVLWFSMMLMPTGPPAMKLITMVQVSDAGVEEEQRMAKILTISYVVSPILAFTVVGALKASEAAL
jgi:predicted permease